MRFFRAAFARIAGVFTGQQADDDVRHELESHIEIEAAENVRRGMQPDEARRQAMLASGGLTQAVEAVRDQRGLPWLESIVADVRYATRALRHNLGFTTIVVATLALGIGANTAIFSVVRGVLLKPLPHRDGDRLVYLRESVENPIRRNLSFSVPEVRDFRAGAPSLGGIAEYSPWFGSVRINDETVRVDLGLVTGNYFEVMGLSAQLGRLTTPADDGQGVPAVVVLTHEFWMRRFGGNRNVIGTQLEMSGMTATVIGVLQPAPFFPDPMDALMNMVVSPHHLSARMVEDRNHRMTELVARLAPGATLEQARTEVDAVFTRMVSENPASYQAAAHPQVAVIPFKKALGERAQLTLWLLMGAAAFVLIISAANVANLTLMRGVRREHELVVRAALGAGMSRLRRLLLAENLLLTLMGASLGVLIAVSGVGLLTSFAARYSPRANEIQLDGTVLGFTLGLALLLAMVLSIMASMPREGTFASISSGAKRFTASLSKHRVQRALVIAQVAVSVVLLAGAGLLTRTMIRLSDVSTGLRTEEVLTLPVPLFDPSRVSAQTDAASKQLYEAMRRDMLALPGVVEVGVGTPMPLSTSMVDLEVKAEGITLDVGEVIPKADLRAAGPEFFRAAGIPLIKGREFDITDGPTSGKVAIINQSLADRFFPGEDPIGKRLAWSGPILKFTPFGGDWRTVVGVVGNTQDGGLDAKPRLAMYMPFAQELAVGGGLVIRADSNVEALKTAATKIVRRHAPLVPLENIRTVAQIKDQSVSPRRLNAMLLSSFSLLAVLIAAVGIAGVLAFSVSARTNEIGIRMSLGAGRGQVQRMILGEGGVLLAIGLVLGVIGASFVGRVMEGLLFGIAPNDPVTLVGVAAMMAAIGIAACWIPARRASRIDPAITMRA
jgi:putative ABC transport system permease protein